MAYAERKTLKGGKVVYYAVYTGPDGRRRTAGSFPSKREAEKTADAQEKTISHGNWVDPTESNDLPRLRRDLLLADHRPPRSLDAGGVPVLPRQALPADLRSSPDAADQPVAGAVVGQRRLRWQARPQIGSEVPRLTAQDLRPSAHRPGRADQPVHAYRAAEGRDAAEADHHRRTVRRDPHPRPSALPDHSAAGDRDRAALG